MADSCENTENHQPDLPKGGIWIRDRWYVPHVERPDSIYFVTFRLADSLPARYAVTNAPNEALCRIQSTLDKGLGNRWLGRQDVATVVQEALYFWHGERYVLGPWAVMPNHVHLLIRPYESEELASIMHGLKSYTANKGNEVLGRTGAFWQREYYDRLVRSYKELDRIARYIVDNPERAGLEPWPWRGWGHYGELVEP
jgi:REP element-mobilizing transposase RayT